MTAPSPTTPSTNEWLADFFHGFPHINFHFTEANSTFDPQDRDYLEGVAFWGLLPVAVCFFLWLVYLIYFIFRCCQSGGTGSRSWGALCLFIFTGLFTLGAIGLLGYGFFGNEWTHQSVETVRRAVVDANTTIMEASDRVDSLNDLAKSVATTESDNIESALVALPPDVREKAQKNVEHIRTEANSVQGYLAQVNVMDKDHDIQDVINISSDAEYYRWLTTILVYVVFLLLLVLTFFGLLMKSKGLLIVMTSLFVFFSLFLWVTTGSYAMASVALSDLCVDPNGYFLGLAKDSSYQGALTAYILCTDTRQPYQQDIQNALTSITEALGDLNKTSELVKPYGSKQLEQSIHVMEDNLDYASGNLSILMNNVGICTSLHQNYVDGVEAACTNTLQGVSVLCLVSAVVAGLCSLLILLLSCAWRACNVNKSPRAQYVPVDDTDPFLPKPPPQYEQGEYGALGHSSPRPWSERGNLQRSSGGDQMVSLVQHHIPGNESPPPAYHPGRYMRPYAENAAGSSMDAAQ